LPNARIQHWNSDGIAGFRAAGLFGSLFTRLRETLR